MWWRITAALAVTWLLGLTQATLEMWMEPEDKNVYYVEEGGPKSIQCLVKVDKGVTVNLTWSGPSIDASKPQRVSNIPQENYDLVGNWLNITHFSNTTAGEYKCRALTSASPPNDLTQTIRLVKGCDVGHFNPPSCNESCSAYCNPVPNGAKGRNCDHINGRCLYGCREGHAGLKCTECDNGRFNPPFCNKNCSTYCNPGPYEAKGRNCDHINGTCLSGCQEGYKMPFCTETSDDHCDKIIGGVIGGVIGLIVVVIIVLLLVRHVKKRRKEYQRPEANEAETMLLKEDKTADRFSEIAILRAEIGRHKQERERQINLRVSQKLENNIIKDEIEAGKEAEMLIATELERLKEEKKKLQQAKEEQIKQTAILEARLQQEHSTNKTTVTGAKLDEMGNLIKELETKLQNATSEEDKFRKQQEEKISEINNCMKRLMGNQVYQDLIEERRVINSSSCSVYDEKILAKIRTVFIQRIIPLNVLHIFHKYNPRILTQPDIEKVTAVTNNHGKFAGAAELLSYLLRYKEWFPCLLQVLRDPDVKQESVANEMEGLLEQDRIYQNLDVDADTSIVTDVCEEQAKLNTLQAETLPLTGFKAETRCTLPHYTTIKSYNTVETNYGEHFDPKKGFYTAPRDGEYSVTFSADHREAMLILRHVHHIRRSLKRSDKRDISDNKQTPFDESKGVREVTHTCFVKRHDHLYLVGSSSPNKVDTTVRFSIFHVR